MPCSELFPGPAVLLLEELEFEVINPNRAEMRAAKVEYLMASGRALAKQQVHLIIAVEVVLIATIPKLNPY